MIVTWIEWSDGGLSMHENTKGLAKETIRGWVHPMMALGKYKPDWSYSSVDGHVKGSADTRQDAMNALKAGLGAVELEESIRNENTARWR